MQSDRSLTVSLDGHAKLKPCCETEQRIKKFEKTCTVRFGLDVPQTRALVLRCIVTIAADERGIPKPSTGSHSAGASPSSSTSTVHFETAKSQTRP